MEDPFTGAAEEVSTQATRRTHASRSRSCLVEVAIGEHTVICLNTEKKIVMLLDPKSMAFISDYMVTLSRQVVHMMSKKTSLTPEPRSPMKPSSEVAPFHLVASPTPCIRDKVVWSPGGNVWKVLPKRQDGKPKKVGPLAVARL